MPLPNFLIAGFGKSGTTALWHYLNHHPDIFLSPEKEVRFFTNPEGDPKKIGNYAKGLTWYENFFTKHRGEKMIGEATPMYLSNPDSLTLIKKDLPTIKLIILLRDPVERLYSGFLHAMRDGKKHDSFLDYARQKYSHRNMYKDDLKRAFSLLPREQILILLTEDLKQHSQKTVKGTLEFLGVNPNFDITPYQKRYNPHQVPKNIKLHRLLVRLNKQSIKLLPPSLYLRLKGLKRKIRDLTSKTEKSQPLDPEIRRQLIHLFEEDIAYVEQLLNRDLKHWRQ